MVGITKRAAVVLRVILWKIGASEQHYVRLKPSPRGDKLRGWLTIDRERPGDEVFSFAGRTILVVDPYTAEVHAYEVLDYRGGAFVFVDSMRHGHLREPSNGATR